MLGTTNITIVKRKYYTECLERSEASANFRDSKMGFKYGMAYNLPSKRTLSFMEVEHVIGCRKMHNFKIKCNIN